MPGLYFTSKGGKNQEVTLRQNYLELPVKFTWLYQDRQNGWWKGLSVSPYGAVRIGEKLKNNTGYGNDLKPVPGITVYGLPPTCVSLLLTLNSATC